MYVSMWPTYSVRNMHEHAVYVHEHVDGMQCTLTCFVWEHVVKHALNMNVLKHAVYMDMC